MKIGLFGCGGIGSNIAMNLVREGFDNFILIDFDKIERSNLNRQFYFENQIGNYKSLTLKENLLSINSTLSLEAHVEKISKENIKFYVDKCDILVEAFDEKNMKELLMENSNGKYFISANGIGGDNLENIEIKKIKRNFIVGDFHSDIKNFNTHCSKVIYISAIMSNIISKILKGEINE
ncbi:sulfur carrier protein ThiS adenylyltransferase [Cetobacterium ceti]|uniref:Sulfur carrier protein ThiS adenylyltransferase n=1 Tax=Cetobacterium ceti TaxID=180163 RepID=A0A1T4MA83_9FUSO|nr:sulfur carrier protein ThiS adenylyltransferase ThiF [Cetobacterium ceti]SJZ63634.1 sulfur carrier protein ThiS adenylyltransferase [Cetobacterium ceti]